MQLEKPKHGTKKVIKEENWWKWRRNKVKHISMPTL